MEESWRGPKAKANLGCRLEGPVRNQKLFHSLISAKSFSCVLQNTNLRALLFLTAILTLPPSLPSLLLSPSVGLESLGYGKNHKTNIWLIIHV